MSWMTSYALIKAEFMHPASRGQMLTLRKRLSGPRFLHSGWEKGKIFVNAILLHGHYLGSGIFLSTHIALINCITQLRTLRILVFLWDLIFYSCHKARLIVVVEAKLCCLSSPRGGFRRTPKVSQRQPLKPTYFSTTRLSNQKTLTT